MASQNVDILFPPGRMVWGDLYRGKDKDFEGRPLVYKTGPDAGKPRLDFSFGVAYPKVPGQHWANSDWGKIVWQVGHAFVANAGQLKDFSWKVIDGDSTEVGKRGRPCDKPGYAGHWIVAFSGSFAPRVVNGLSGKFEDLTTQDYVNPGDYVQVKGSVAGNNSQGNPGVYINHGVVCFSGYGERIRTGLDPSAAGFQTGAVAGAQQTPVGAAALPPAPGAAPAPAAPPVPGAPVASPPTPAAPAPVAVTPNPSFAPPVPAAPPVPGAPPATAARVMLPAAGGVPYEEFIKAGWTDAQLIQHGKMAA